MDKRDTLSRIGLLRAEIASLEESLGIQRDSDTPQISAGQHTALADHVFRTAPVFISVHAANGDYIYASPGVTTLLGYSPEQMVGRNAYEFFYVKDIERIAADHAGHDEGALQRIEYRIKQSDGAWHWVETVSQSYVDPESEERFIVAVTTGIQDRRDQRANLLKLNRELRAKNERLAELATRDDLTGLVNRREVLRAVNAEIDRSSRYGTNTCVGLADIDSFKRINDEFGHAAGDDAIVRAASIIQDSVRTADLASRYGGDEFLILWTNTSLNVAGVAAERLRAAFETEATDPGKAQTVSIGVAQWRPGQSVEELIKVADEALYRAKDRGRNRVELE